MRQRGRIVNRPELLHVYRDTELNILHSNRDCPMAKIAVKYGFLVNVTGTVHLNEKAQGFGWKACPKCGEKLVLNVRIPIAEAIKPRR